MDKAWAHVHLPRLRSGQTTNVISLKVPGWAIEYASVVSMGNAEFRVHEKGRQRCIENNVRNVHAWVVGDLIQQYYDVTGDYELDPTVWRQAVYDPWKGGTFVDLSTLAPVYRAYYVLMIGKDVFYRNY